MRTIQRGALYALVLLAPFSLFWARGEPAAPDILPLYVTPGIHLSDLAMAAVLISTLVSGAGGKAARWLLPLMALAVLGLLLSPLALDPSLARYTAARWLLSAALYLALSQSDLLDRRVVALFLVGIGGQVAVGVGQVLAQAPLGLPGELALPPQLPGAAILEVAGGRWLRAYGLTFHPNVLGGFVATALLLALPWLDRWRGRLLWWGLWLGLLLSFSRASWVAVALVLPPTLAWLAWRHPARRRTLALAVAGAGCVLLLVGIGWSGQFATRLAPFLPRLAPAPTASPAPLPAPTERLSLDTRVAMSRIAVALIAARPMQGVGAGNFPLAMQRAEPRIPAQYVHNVPLLLAAEGGLLSGLLWLALAAIALVALVRRRATRDPWRIVPLSAWLALWIIGLADSYPWALDSGRLLTILLLALSDRLGEPSEAG